MFALTTAFVAAFLASNAAAHGGVNRYIIDGELYEGWAPFSGGADQETIGRPYSSYNPIMDAADATIHCNDDGSASANQLTATVAAGAEITAQWDQWTHREGPVMVYMADCGGDCSAVDSSTLEWFKIDEAGLLSGTVGDGEWGNGVVVDTLEWTSTIPESLAPGNYLIRHELLALHQSNTPQFYPECAQLEVTGSGSAKPSGDALVSFPGGYSMSDPGVTIDIYDSATAAETTYQAPGPAVWSG
ncbi:glycoside hydrolase family 61 protein [Schizophyllum amplum]|uniref:AA9 family lytic polysaccharide monooxygenase n=1 Tax=Schizophyllum amplum TaxID=97359 RepID=A0A550CTE5_9AGAR|nr:glycoside hydrolase family 61 protein [Auriculariopsis ampla]